MTINEGVNLLNALAHESIKSKHFSIQSLTGIAFLKKKINDAITDHNYIVTELAASKAKKVDNSFVARDDSEEAKADYAEYEKEFRQLHRKNHDCGKINFVTPAELEKVVEDTSVEIATTLIYWLIKADNVAVNGATKEKIGDLKVEIDI